LDANTPSLCGATGRNAVIFVIVIAATGQDTNHVVQAETGGVGATNDVKGTFATTCVSHDALTDRQTLCSASLGGTALFGDRYTLGASIASHQLRFKSRCAQDRCVGSGTAFGAFDGVTLRCDQVAVGLTGCQASGAFAALAVAMATIARAPKAVDANETPAEFSPLTGNKLDAFLGIIASLSGTDCDRSSTCPSCVSTA